MSFVRRFRASELMNHCQYSLETVGLLAKASLDRPNLREGEKTTWVPEAEIFIDFNGREHRSKKEEEHGCLMLQQSELLPSQLSPTSIVTELIGGTRK